MSVEEIVGRLLNPGVILTLIAAGAAGYGLFLWALNVQPLGRLYAVAIVPGFIFGMTILTVRALQSEMLAPVYAVLVIDWLIFAHAGFVAVLIERKRHKRP